MAQPVPLGIVRALMFRGKRVCLLRALMSVCGHRKTPRVNGVDMAASLKAGESVFTHIYLLCSYFMSSKAV